MDSIEKELKILRQFIHPKHMDGLKKWKCYSEDEISAAEKRLHGKLPFPIRDIYLHMADLLITSGYLRPLELLHWEGKYLGFFLIGFSRLSAAEFFVFRKTETCETENHLLCGWCSKCL